MKQFLESKELLRTVTEESKQVNEEAKQLVGSLNETQLNWKPAPERWSIAQCLDHLRVSSEGYNNYLPNAIGRGREKWPTSGAVSYHPTLMGGWLIKQLLPENTRKIPAPKIFRPAASSSIHDSLNNFLKQQEVFLNFVNNANGFDYNKARLRSPVTPLVRYSVADTFVLIVVHNRRHLAQALRVKQDPNFPNS